MWRWTLKSRNARVTKMAVVDYVLSIKSERDQDMIKGKDKNKR